MTKPEVPRGCTRITIRDGNIKYVLFPQLHAPTGGPHAVTMSLKRITFRNLHRFNATYGILCFFLFIHNQVRCANRVILYEVALMCFVSASTLMPTHVVYCNSISMFRQPMTSCFAHTNALIIVQIPSRFADYCVVPCRWLSKF